MDKLQFDSKLIHAGYSPEAETHSRQVPLYMTTAYTFDSTEAARKAFLLQEPANIYTRIMNPTCDVLERRIADLEGGIGALSACSGHGAMTMTFLCLASAGDEIVAARAIYGGAVNLMSKTFAKMGITFRFVDGDDPDAFDRATNEKTRAYFIETIGNPNADVPDIEAIAKIAHKHGVPLIADNTVATPWLLRPIEWGADIVVHSATKFLSGNGTAMGGLVVDSGNFPFLSNPRFPEFNTPDESYHGVIYAKDMGNQAFITKLRTHILRDIGACQSPFNAWLTLLGMETLNLRMERHCQSGLAVAEFLAAHPKVARVNYPHLSDSPYKAMADKYVPRGGSSVFTFDIDGDREAAARFCDAVKMISIVTNLGDARTILSCPAATTHSQLSDEKLHSIGIEPGTIRLSVGLEDVNDIIADLTQALSAI